MAKDPAGKWEHTTIFKVPAHTLVHVTIYQYDGASGLRNNFLSGVSRHDRRGRERQRQARELDQPRQCRAHLHGPGPRHQRRRCRASTPTRRICARRAMHAVRAHMHDHLQLPLAQARAPTAGSASFPAAPAPVRQRRADADDRLHGRPDRGRVSDASATAARARASRATAPQLRDLGGGHGDHGAADDLGDRAAHPARHDEPADRATSTRWTSCSRRSRCRS